jgi:hypothetical protein
MTYLLTDAAVQSLWRATPVFPLPPPEPHTGTEQDRLHYDRRAVADDAFLTAFLRSDEMEAPPLERDTSSRAYQTDTATSAGVLGFFMELTPPLVRAPTPEETGAKAERFMHMAAVMRAE